MSVSLLRLGLTCILQHCYMVYVPIYYIIYCNSVTVNYRYHMVYVPIYYIIYRNSVTVNYRYEMSQSTWGRYTLEGYYWVGEQMDPNNKIRYS